MHRATVARQHGAGAGGHAAAQVVLQQRRQHAVRPAFITRLKEAAYAAVDDPDKMAAARQLSSTIPCCLQELQPVLLPDLPAHLQRKPNLVGSEAAGRGDASRHYCFEVGVSGHGISEAMTYADFTMPAGGGVPRKLALSHLPVPSALQRRTCNLLVRAVEAEEGSSASSAACYLPEEYLREMRQPRGATVGCDDTFVQVIQTSLLRHGVSYPEYLARAAYHFGPTLKRVSKGAYSDLRKTGRAAATLHVSAHELPSFYPPTNR